MKPLSLEIKVSNLCTLNQNFLIKIKQNNLSVD